MRCLGQAQAKQRLSTSPSRWQCQAPLQANAYRAPLDLGRLFYISSQYNPLTEMAGSKHSGAHELNAQSLRKKVYASSSRAMKVCQSQTLSSKKRKTAFVQVLHVPHHHPWCRLCI
eukprot:1959462-Amphidinium_carterae.1